MPKDCVVILCNEERPSKVVYQDQTQGNNEEKVEKTQF